MTDWRTECSSFVGGVSSERTLSSPQRAVGSYIGTTECSPSPTCPSLTHNFSAFPRCSSWDHATDFWPVEVLHTTCRRGPWTSFSTVLHGLSFPLTIGCLEIRGKRRFGNGGGPLRACVESCPSSSHCSSLDCDLSGNVASLTSHPWGLGCLS